MAGEWCGQTGGDSTRGVGEHEVQIFVTSLFYFLERRHKREKVYVVSTEEEKPPPQSPGPSAPQNLVTRQVVILFLEYRVTFMIFEFDSIFVYSYSMPYSHISFFLSYYCY
jgi:hypothetical protein